ncbi:hypothetical protein [Streptomyces sp. AS02]|uniref:hypothetical protein n=1 Tax=Streptomyces sp. AS02 TaxID=2938946 RepID=UPI00201FD32F|nr:hypothetical protein [Streptomyces sp. AS02]MCL8016981.1 hypothetical protein [Streptomyces sp. AS02]
MRRPAQHRPGLAAAHGQALLYTDPLAAAVLHNSDGGQGGSPATPPPTAVPSPAEIAARAGQQPPTPAPPPAAAANPGEEEVTFTQRRLNKKMAEEKEEGRRAAYRAIAEAAGIDPDTFDPSKFGEVFKQAEQARQQALSEEQRRAEELQRREQALQAREDAAAQREKEAADRDRSSRIRAALVKLGATGDDLEDAAALLRVADDATDDDITQAAEKLKERRAEMFGTTPAPQTLPPAPSGGPAGGNAPRQPASSKDAVKEEARKWADRLGYGTSGSSAA